MENWNIYSSTHPLHNHGMNIQIDVAYHFVRAIKMSLQIVDDIQKTLFVSKILLNDAKPVVATATAAAATESTVLSLISIEKMLNFKY